MRFGLATAVVALVLLVIAGDAGRALGGFLLLVGGAVVAKELMAGRTGD